MTLNIITPNTDKNISCTSIVILMSVFLIVMSDIIMLTFIAQSASDKHSSLSSRWGELHQK